MSFCFSKHTIVKHLFDFSDFFITTSKDFFFSSLYTTAFTPVFLEASEKTFRRYLNYIVSLQKEFREKIQFCFDPDFYPHVLGHLYPFERYQLYCSIYKEFPNEVSRTETFHVFRGTSNNEKMPFKDTGALLQERLAMKIDNDSDEYKEFVEKYADRESLSVAEFFAKLLHKQYGYVVTMTIDAPVKSTSHRAVSSRVRALRGVAKSADNRPYKDILAEALAERYET